MLTGHVNSDREIKQRIEQLGITPPSPISILVFQFGKEITPKIEKNISYTITTTQQLQIVLHVIDGNELILLVSPLPTKEVQSSIAHFINEFILQMDKRYNISDIKASCGNIYDNYEKVEASYQEALTVLRLKTQFSEEVGDIYSYQQLGIFRYLDVIFEKKKVDQYENPALRKLAEYDKVNKTYLVETLEVFLNKDSNINEAAKELHVHANTLNYRLKRISEIGDIDLKNPNQKMTLYLDIKTNKLDKQGRL
ncbi:helix-turn-helix domain-containing protein [Anaerobacillus sp. CMMVII]|uniref:PucR family transcriptional regulator n=1 Tax=Anaerobacillus sp. CMMVII TaxID=2755588 RepID=UPI0028E0A186|nr:helix-turn-helix domain-containing protein [Anaerobacillus sp. CMMVII]